MRNTEIQIWPIARLLPYARTLRRNDEAVDRMVAAFKEFRLMLPLLVRSEGEIVDGHLRLKAARKLQLTEVPVILCDDWTPAQVKAFRLLVNRSATWAQWDWKEVAAEFADLQILNFDLPLTGFDGAEIDKLLLQFRDPDSDALIPPPDRVPVSAPQDLWICGEHRILCGDATIRRMESITIRRGVKKPGSAGSARQGKSAMTIESTGPRLTNCSTAMWRMSGMQGSLREKWRDLLPPQASGFGRRSSGPSNTSR
jgi:ParB-like nuclease family protein